MSFLEGSEVPSDDIAIPWLLMRLANTKVGLPSIHMSYPYLVCLGIQMAETGIYVSQPTEPQFSLQH